MDGQLTQHPAPVAGGLVAVVVDELVLARRHGVYNIKSEWEDGGHWGMGGLGSSVGGGLLLRCLDWCMAGNRGFAAICS